MVPLVRIDQHDTSGSITEQQRPLVSQENQEEEQSGSPDLPHSPSKSSNFGRFPVKRRKVVGGLRPVYPSSKRPTGPTSIARMKPVDDNPAPLYNEIPRQLQSDIHKLPQRKRAVATRTTITPPSATKLIASIWKTVYGSICMKPPTIFVEHDARLSTQDIKNMDRETFSQINAVCLKASTLSKSARALEATVQAHWMDCYYARIKVLAEENPQLSLTEAKMAGLGEACSALGWTQKELRNRMMVWRGYKDVKDSGGWVALVFAGSGIYSICKYRIGFEDGLMQRLSKLRTSIEVAADTLHPAWRYLLATIGQHSERRYTGHPHSWVVSADKSALPLASTYGQSDPDFSFEHLEECVIDNCWRDRDPRRVYTGNVYICSECGQEQSEELQTNKCVCFPSLVAPTGHMLAPVQVGRCPRGKNNGLFSRCGFERGTAVGEFVGLVTKGIEGKDVMMSGHGDNQYQIYQRRVGNYTRFINHSCAPNAQFTKFVWRGLERIMVVSKGIDPGMEITVDYSPSYWTNLEKVCVCGEPCCRYSRPHKLFVSS